MNFISAIQFILGIGFLLTGLYIFAVELIGVFKFKYILNRMHAAAMGDTIGIGLSLIGLMILSGWNYTSLKMALIIVFLWLASPVSSHLISRLEVTTNEEIDTFCERKDLEVVLAAEKTSKLEKTEEIPKSEESKEHTNDLETKVEAALQKTPKAEESEEHANELELESTIVLQKIPKPKESKENVNHLEEDSFMNQIKELYKELEGETRV